MQAVVVGGGPAGLYCGLLIKKARPLDDVTVIERNPRDATYGWGVTFSDRTLAEFRDADYRSYKDITDQFVIWDAIDVRFRDDVVRAKGHVISGISRKALLKVLQAGCEGLGVKLRFEDEVPDIATYSGCDLLVGADGVRSMVRDSYADAFRPSLQVGRAKYIWLGTDRLLDSFTFIFRQNEHGMFQVHAFPYDGNLSTFIVECEEGAWRRAGLDQADEAQSIAYCEKLFADELRGHALMSNNSRWISFVTVRNQSWSHGNTVLLGDAAHTAHFSIGSGTKLAMEDAISLANALERHGDDLHTAMAAYESERRPAVEAFQEAALRSLTYFENVKRYAHLEPVQFAFHLLSRSGRASYGNLRQRDPYFVDRVSRWFAEANGNETSREVRTVVTPLPMLVPLTLRGTTLANRVVLSPPPTYAADDGTPDERYLDTLVDEALGGAALIMTQPTAVSAQGRMTEGCSGIYLPEHVAAWKRAVEKIEARTSAKIAVHLNHSGRRGSTRPRSVGLDRPLLRGNWRLLSASPVPYTPHSQPPKEVDRSDIERVLGDFVGAAQMAEEAGFHMIQLNFAHGYLLSSFISPLTNLREDEFGGSLERRMRFPLEVFHAVRAVWPSEKPIAVAISATDWVRGGTDVSDAVAVADMLKASKCDLVTVMAGQTTAEARPLYGPGFLTLLSDQVRNEARVPTLTAGHITTTDEINEILAAGRADLCVLEPSDLAE